MSKFLKDLIERAVSTAAAAAVAAIVATGATDARVVQWATVGGTAALAGVLSALKSLAARNVGASDSASLVPEVGS